MNATDLEAPARAAPRIPYTSENVLQALRVPGDRVRRALALWFWAAVVISAAFVLAVGIRFAAPHFMSSVFSRIQLTSENNVAAWWSGVLLLMLAVHAYDVGMAERARSATVAGAWAILSGILLFFSADEIGSLHERMGMLGRPFDLGSWPMMMLAGAVVGIALIAALWRLWRDANVSRRLVVPLFIGFGLLGSVAGQEYIGDILVFESASARGIRAMLEEGTELLGMLFLLATILPLTFGREPDGSTSFLRIPDSGICKLLLVAALCTPVFAVMPEVIGMDHKGQIANWLAAACLMLAALLALRALERDGRHHPTVLWLIAGLCVIGSVCAVSIAPDTTVGIGGADFNLRLVVLGFIAVAVCGLWLAAKSRSGPEGVLVAAAVAIWALIAPVMAMSVTAVFLLTQGLAVALAAGTLLHVSRETVAAATPAAGSVGPA